MSGVDRLQQRDYGIKWQRIESGGPGLHLPKREHDIGWDLEASQDVFIRAGFAVDVPTNIKLELPELVWAEIRARSSIARLHLQVEAGTIDPGYRGPLFALVRNMRPVIADAPDINSYTVKQGDRIAQVVFHRVCCVWALEVEHVRENTDRGRDGFGSTGR